MNEAHWRRPDGPVFLYIGGEGPISESTVLAGIQRDEAHVLTCPPHPFKHQNTRSEASHQTEPHPLPPGHHVAMAEEHGALLLALEHRFYGDSINPDGLKTENLSGLNSQQALVSRCPNRVSVTQRGHSFPSCPCTSLRRLKRCFVCVLSRLADLAVFHQHISQSFSLSQRNTWISFGGSYAGALSAWFRGKVPTALAPHIRPSDRR